MRSQARPGTSACLIHKAIRDFRCGKLAKEIHTPNHIYSESAHHGDGFYANFKLTLTYFFKIKFLKHDFWALQQYCSPA